MNGTDACEDARQDASWAGTEKIRRALLQGTTDIGAFTQAALAEGSSLGDAHDTGEFIARVRENQLGLKGQLRAEYDYIVCGSGSSGSVIARRLAEDPGRTVLLLEAGGSDDVPNVRDPGAWFTNLGSERDWSFTAAPNPHLNSRAIPYSMGKVLGGGSSINIGVWARGHRNDWNHFAAEAGDDAWNYEAALRTYQRIEDWHGAPDPDRRGTGGPLYVQPAPDPNPIAPAMLSAAADAGIPTFADHNGAMMEGAGGAALVNLCIRDGCRVSVFRSYVYPLMAQPNLTVLTHASVTRVLLQGSRATGVEVRHGGQVLRIKATAETILSLGAVNTPKVLMQSGIGDAAQLERHGIPVAQHLPGVGRNMQDHVMMLGCAWEYAAPLPMHSTGAEATLLWKSDAALDTPDLQAFQAQILFTTPEAQARFNPSPASWMIAPGVIGPKSRGEVALTGPEPADPVTINPNLLAEPEDMAAMLRCVEICREIGNGPAMRPFVKREAMPGSLRGASLKDFVRSTAATFWHQSCTAKMGRDELSVVDAWLRVYGIDKLRVADASIMPRVTAGNTMAPCVVIGERLSEFLTWAR